MNISTKHHLIPFSESWTDVLPRLCNVSFKLKVNLQLLFSQKLKTTHRYFRLNTGEVIDLEAQCIRLTRVDRICVRQPSSKASIAGRSSFMVLTIGFGPNSLQAKHILVYQLQSQPYVICTASITEYFQMLDSVFPDPSWWFGYCYQNKRECNLNQSNADFFVERMAKNNCTNNGNRHKVDKIFPIDCFVLVIT